MNILHESCLIASAPAETLVALAVFFGVSAVILFALSIEAGNYPELLRWRRLGAMGTQPRNAHSAQFNSYIWKAIAGGYGYEYDRTP